LGPQHVKYPKEQVIELACGLPDYLKKEEFLKSLGQELLFAIEVFCCLLERRLPHVLQPLGLLSDYKEVQHFVSVLSLG